MPKEVDFGEPFISENLYEDYETDYRDLNYQPYLEEKKFLIEPRPKPNNLRKGMLGFKYNGHYHIAQPMIVFRPMGLMIWNVPDDCYLAQSMIGTREQILASVDPIPAKFFTMANTYEQVSKSLEEHGIEPPSWAEFDTLTPAHILRIRFTDKDGKRIETPHVQLACWGYSVVY